MSQRIFLGTAVLMTAMAMCASTAARADDTGFHVGAGFGKATQSSRLFDGEDTAYRLFAGYSFGRHFAVEAGFIDGGAQQDQVGALDVISDNQGVFLSLLGRWPVGERFAPYAKLGVVSYESDTTISNGSVTIRESGHDEDLSYGGGLEFKVTERFRLRADYEKVRVPDVAFDLYTLVAAFQF